MEDQIDFNDILEGKQTKKVNETPKVAEIKLTNTDTRKRQQSCMVADIDKNLLPENTKIAPQSFRVSLADMLSIDKTDQSLEKYKKTLLGNIKEEELKEDQPAEVQILKVEVVCETRPKGNIILDFKEHLMGKHQYAFTIKEGEIYHLRLHFIVRYDIVYGLRFVNNIWKSIIHVSKDDQKLGTFAPNSKPQIFDLPAEQAPTGFMARGEYKGKGLLLDKDQIVHCQFDYLLHIEKDW